VTKRIIVGRKDRPRRSSEKYVEHNNPDTLTNKITEGGVVLQNLQCPRENASLKGRKHKSEVGDSPSIHLHPTNPVYRIRITKPESFAENDSSVVTGRKGVIGA